MASNQVRIIGGKWKGRKLGFPNAGELRPTLGRARETLFNWLIAELPGSRCLDLFAGSGALGFEALSRGASSVTFVERNRRASEAISANLAQLDCTSATVRCTTAGAFLQTDNTRWDIVFVDPPFARHPAANTVLRALLSGAHLNPGALVYLEQSKRARFEFAGLAVRKHQTAGDCQFGILTPMGEDGDR